MFNIMSGKTQAQKKEFESMVWKKIYPRRMFCWKHFYRVFNVVGLMGAKKCFIMIPPPGISKQYLLPIMVKHLMVIRSLRVFKMFDDRFTQIILLKVYAFWKIITLSSSAFFLWVKSRKKVKTSLIPTLCEF